MNFMTSLYIKFHHTVIFHLYKANKSISDKLSPTQTQMHRGMFNLRLIIFLMFTTCYLLLGNQPTLHCHASQVNAVLEASVGDAENICP